MLFSQLPQSIDIRDIAPSLLAHVELEKNQAHIRFAVISIDQSENLGRLLLDLPLCSSGIASSFVRFLGMNRDSPSDHDSAAETYTCWNNISHLEPSRAWRDVD